MRARRQGGMWAARAIACAFAALTMADAARAQSGVLLPRDKDHADPAVLSLEEMNVSVVIDDGDARVRITQIFANHTNKIEEGTYRFALPSGSTVSDFGVWDGPVRIPAVILERKRAEEVYNEARLQAIDPGLLETGERSDGADAKTESVFTAKIVPIPAYGTKRLELEYHQRLQVNGFAQGFVLPLAPGDGAAQVAARLSVKFELHSTLALTGFTLRSKAYAMQMSAGNAHTASGAWEATKVALSEDFAASWKLDEAGADKLAVSVFRATAPARSSAADSHANVPSGPEPGFFLAQTLIGAPGATVAVAQASSAPSRDVVVLFDNSASMQWDKLERSYGALEKVLLGLRPSDEFSLLLFNSEVAAFAPAGQPATTENVQRALAFVKAARLRGGTDLGKALAAGLTQAKGANASLILLSDGNSDRGATVLAGKIAAAYSKAWKASAAHPRTNIFAVGDDANLPLLRLLAQNDGLLESVLSSEPIDAKLDAFLAHSIARPVGNLRLEVTPVAAVHTVYPLDPNVYAGSVASWVGDYVNPARGVRFTVSGKRGEQPFQADATADLPAEASGHPQLPRLWAQARVNALLDLIARDGETREAVDEIIRLSRRYKFVTPYTSFLAAPRSLLRPRVIRPGDPVLRVHTDPSITSVIALFPFGLTKPLRHLASEDKQKGPDSDRLWETRFLAPPDMTDGAYAVRLILRDARGNTYAEQKTFVIASTAPTVRVKLEHTRVHRGELMTIHAGASATTRTLTARLEGAAPVDLRWSGAASASTGQMRVPETLAPGQYVLSVTAEDIAHNVGTGEVRIDVVP